MKRAGWLALVVPALGCLFIWHTGFLGLRVAALHLGFGVVVSAVLMELLFVRCRFMPFVSAYERSGELDARGIAAAGGLLFASFALAWIERSALTSPTRYLQLIAVMIGFAATVRAFDRASGLVTVPIVLDQPPPLPTQRLDLVR